MPVHIPPPDSRLAVTFCRDAEPPQTMIASDGANAWGHAIALITQRKAAARRHADSPFPGGERRGGPRRPL
jgi:hypothetical protein